MRYLLVFALFVVGCSQPPSVATVAVTKAELVDSFREEAETRLKRTYLVSMPVSGRIGRIDLEPGDRVRRGQRLAVIDRLPLESTMREHELAIHELRGELRVAENTGPEAAAEAEAVALRRDAQQRLSQERAALLEAQQTARQASVERQRTYTLYLDGATTRQASEQATLQERNAQARVEQARARVKSQVALVAAAEQRIRAAESQTHRRELLVESTRQRLAQAETRLQRAAHEASQAFVSSPIDGVVVERHQTGPGPVGAGERLLSLAKLQDLEAVAEVLTQDALRLKVGTPVRLLPGPQVVPLQARVQRIEPRGFTKLSSLGVEQKRVLVHLRLDKAPAAIGAGYRLEAEFVVGRVPGALTLPRETLLQKPDGSPYVWRVAQGRIQEQPVKVGVMEDLRFQVVDGLHEGDRVVAAPDSSLRQGDEVSVDPRP